MAVTVTLVAQNTFASSTTKSLTEAATPVAGDVYVLVTWRQPSGADTSVTGLGATWTRDLADTSAIVPYLAFWVGRGATASGTVTYTHATAQPGNMALYRIRGLTQSLVLWGLLTDFTNVGATGSSPEVLPAAAYRINEPNTALIASGGVGAYTSPGTTDLTMTGGSATITADSTWDTSSNRHARYGFYVPTVGDTVQWSIDNPGGNTTTFRDMGVLLIGGASQVHLDHSQVGALTQEPVVDKRLDLSMVEVLADLSTVADKRLDVLTLAAMTDLAPPLRQLDLMGMDVLTDPVVAPATGRRGWGMVVQ